MQKTLKRLGLILVALMLCFVMAFSLAACGDRGDEGNNGNTGNTGNNNDDDEDDDVPVTGVTISGEPTEPLTVGQNHTLSATVQPADASNKRVTWSSSDEEVVTVSSGLLTAVGGGTATITVTTADGGKTDTCEITVTSIPVAGITISETSLSLTEGDQHNLTVTIVPDNASNKDITWTSDNEEVATVNSVGAVLAVGAGTANITAATADGPKASCAVTVAARDNSFVGYTEIDSVEDWALIGQNLSGKYVLTADIDFGGRQVDTIGNPVGGSGTYTAFNGTIDGNGYAIMNAHFVSGGKSDAGVPNNSNSGMVAELGAAGVIRNLSIIDCATSGEAYNAMIAVWNNGLIENCYVQGSVGNDNQWWDGWTLGGVLVNINRNNGIIRNCVSWSDYSGLTYGLVGSNFATPAAGSNLTSCVYNNYIVQSTTSDYALNGEIVGDGNVQPQPLENCYYITAEDAKKADTFTYLNSYWWVIEDGKVPYVKTSVEGGRDWQGPDIPEEVIIPEISIDQPADTTFQLSNGATMLSYTLSPSGAEELEGITVTWSSGADNIATVDENGIVSFKAAGQVTITATLTYGDITDTASITLTITA